MAIVGSALVAKYNNFTFNVTNTLRNETIDVNSISADFVISIDGTIVQNKTPASTSATVVLVGGLDTFVNEKSQRTPKFYITENQKVILYNILKQVALVTDTAQITSDNETLEQIAYATYFNYCG